MIVVRILLGLALAAALAALVLRLTRPAPEPAPAGEFTSSAQCRECHPEVYAEWEGSWHARSWIDPDVFAQSNGFENKDCIDCHAPRGVFETGIGQRVLPRSSRRAEGVDCLACHLLPGGGVAGTLDDPRAACRPVTTRELSSPEFCAGCHNQHGTVDQWRASEWGQRGEGCVDCHMPFRAGDPNLGRDHTLAGGHDLALVRGALAMRAARSGASVEVELANVAVGHAFPTDERSRASDLWWKPAGEQDWRHAHRIRDPYRYETDLPRTLLEAGERRVVTIDDPDAAGPIDVLWVYKLTPHYRLPESGEPIPLEAVVDPTMDAQELFRARVE